METPLEKKQRDGVLPEWKQKRVNNGLTVDYARGALTMAERLLEGFDQADDEKREEMLKMALHHTINALVAIKNAE